MQETLNNASININPFINDDLTEEQCSKLRTLTHLFVAKEHRGKGEAKALLEKVTSEASQADITLIVEPKPYDDGLTKKQLINLYTKAGFEELQPKPLLMVKYPNKPIEH